MAASLKDVKNQAFDYIIIGGGAAGLTLAARLSEDTDKTVCVLEAGGANLDDLAILRPGGYGTHFGNKAYDWARETTKQTLLSDRVCPLNSGRGLGGSSAINFMVYTKPPANELDDIERLGNPGWNWTNLQHYMNKAVSLIEPTQEFKDSLGIRGLSDLNRDGPLLLAYPPIASGIEPIMRDTMHNLGITDARRPFGGETTGTYITPNTRDPKTQSRTYSVTAYYLPNVGRRNLTVLVNAHATRVITEGVDGDVTATGAEFEHNGEVHVVYARKEVIVSSGAMGSPQVLELSGIGDKRLLERLGISVKVDLPGVGENMQEHILSGVTYELDPSRVFNTFDALRDPEQLAEHVKLYESGKGLFTLGIIGFSFLPVETISPHVEAIYKNAKEDLAKTNPSAGLDAQYDIQLRRIAPGSDSAPQCEFICNPLVLSWPNPPVQGRKYFTVSLSLNQLFSRGTVHVASSDPRDAPEINPHYFEHDVDLQIFTEMVKFARKLATVSPMKDIVVSELNPGPAIQTDEQIRTWLKETFLTTWHTASTCSMLPREKDGVVDNKLKAGLIEFALPRLTQFFVAMAYGIAEQAADIIKGKLKL
ncbi:hypothetical protein NM688_g7255 [Phlebia brevispora]|uniref:Uncharacterized protein n=1 Tax=Phlebia brevispora TaxID=194682 RepID=A0ACC1S7A5_9APHY|nr:hypothetical protein NM688_g7255 [Phlebia brevispora]